MSFLQVPLRDLTTLEGELNSGVAKWQSEDRALRERLKRAFHESGKLYQKSNLRPADVEPPHNTDNLDPRRQGKGHRKKTSLSNITKPTPVPVEEKPEFVKMPYATINYSAPVLKRFSGKSGEHQSITDFIEALERQAGFEYRDDDVAREKLLLSLFRTNLKGSARSFLNMLTPSEKEDWTKLKEVYIYKYKAERETKAKQRAKEQCASFRQRSDESLRAYGERAMRLRQLIDGEEEAFLV